MLTLHGLSLKSDDGRILLQASGFAGNPGKERVLGFGVYKKTLKNGKVIFSHDRECTVEKLK